MTGCDHPLCDNQITILGSRYCREHTPKVRLTESEKEELLNKLTDSELDLEDIGNREGTDLNVRTRRPFASELWDVSSPE